MMLPYIDPKYTKDANEQAVTCWLIKVPSDKKYPDWQAKCGAEWKDGSDRPEDVTCPKCKAEQ